MDPQVTGAWRAATPSPADALGAAGPELPERRAAGVVGWGCGIVIVGLLASCLLAGIYAIVPDPRGFALVAAGAFAPAVAYAWIVLAIGGVERGSRRRIAGALAGGAFLATVASIVVELAAGAILGYRLGGVTGAVSTVVIVAPVVEESAKGLTVLSLLLMARRTVPSLGSGLVCGALVGLGFATIENLTYFAGAYTNDGGTGLRDLVFVRAALVGHGHALATALTGAALGWTWGGGRRGAAALFVPVGGWTCAVALHMIWNGGAVTVTRRLDDPPVLAAGLLTAMIFAPPSLVAVVLLRRALRDVQLALLRKRLPTEVRAGVLTDRDIELLVDPRARRRAAWAAYRTGGRAALARHRRFQRLATSLGHHARDLDWYRSHPGRGAGARVRRAEAAMIATRTAVASTPRRDALPPATLSGESLDPGRVDSARLLLLGGLLAASAGWGGTRRSTAGPARGDAPLGAPPRPSVFEPSSAAQVATERAGTAGR